MDRQAARQGRTVLSLLAVQLTACADRAHRAFTGKSQAGGFGDFVAQTDADAGRILRALEENGFADNTLVIFTADNGAEHYAYERIRNFQHRSSGPLRGLKRDL